MASERMSCMKADCSHLKPDAKRLNYPYCLYLYFVLHLLTVI